MSKRKLMLANGVLAVAVLAAVASTDDNEATRVDDDADEDGSDGAGGESGTFVVGDVVELGDWHVQDTLARERGGSRRTSAGPRPAASPREPVGFLAGGDSCAFALVR